MFCIKLINYKINFLFINNLKLVIENQLFFSKHLKSIKLEKN